MATRNYQHEKRQKELAKRAKKLEKAQRRAERKEQGPGDDPSLDGNGETEETPTNE